MIRKLIFSICMICPLLAGCTDDDMMPSSQTPVSSETVPVRLNFSTEAFNTPFQGDTRSGEESTVLSVSNQDMNIELVKTPVTRDAVAAIDKENAVFSTTLINTAETSARLTVVWAATRCESPFNVSSLLTCERA